MLTLVIKTETVKFQRKSFMECCFHIKQGLGVTDVAKASQLLAAMKKVQGDEG